MTKPLSKSKLSSNVEMNEQYGLVNFAGKTMVVTQKKDPQTGYIVDQFIRPGELSKLLSNQLAHTEGGENIYTSTGQRKPEKKFEHWMESETRNTYTGVTFKPTPQTFSENKLYLPKTGGEYNRWKGLSIIPKEGEHSKIRQHIYEIWCNEDVDLFTYVWGWLARMVQQPQKRAETAILLRSGQGTGKNIIVDILAEYFGIHGMVVTSQEQVTGRFNGHLGLCVFLFASEAVWGGDKKFEGTLKSLITDEYRTVEEKYSKRPVNRT